VSPATSWQWRAVGCSIRGCLGPSGTAPAPGPSRTASPAAQALGPLPGQRCRSASQSCRARSGRRPPLASCGELPDSLAGPPLCSHERKTWNKRSTNFMLRAAGHCALPALRAASTRRCACALLAPGAARPCVLRRASHPAVFPVFFRQFSTGSARIGFIGLGNMGQAMATNILKAHGSAIVYDVRVNVCVCARGGGIPWRAFSDAAMAHLLLDRDIHLDHCRGRWRRRGLRRSRL
jgi:hypothetical protein